MICPVDVVFYFFFLGCKNSKSWSLELQVLKVPGFQRDPLQPPCNRFFGSNLPGSTLVWQHISDGVWILHATRDSSNLRVLVVLVSFLSPPLPTLCVCVWVCEWALSLSASPGGAWSSCSVFFTSLAIFSPHCGSLHILGSGSQLCGSVNVMKHLSTFFRRRKLIKLPASPSCLHLRKLWPSWAFPCGSEGLRVEWDPGEVTQNPLVELKTLSRYYTAHLICQPLKLAKRCDLTLGKVFRLPTLKD